MTPLQEAKLDEIHAMLKALAANSAAPSTASSGGNGKWENGGGMADDAFLPGPYGNPSVFKAEPKEWTGPSQVGVKASDVPVAYGIAYAEMMDRFGDKAKREGQLDKNGKPTYWRKYQEAGCFRAWAKQNQATPKTTRAPYVDETDLPFSGAA